MSFRGLGVEAFRMLLEATLQNGSVVLHESCGDFDDIDEDDDAAADDGNGTLSKTGEPSTINVMTMRDSTGHTPLGLLFRRYRERVRCVIKAVEKLRTEHEGTIASIATAVTVQADLGELWHKARIIVGRLTEERLQREGILGEALTMNSPGEEAVAQGAAAWASERHRRSQYAPSGSASPDYRHFRIVHASVGLTGYGCPPELLRLAISIHPNQVKEMDEDGNLPLHIAAVASSYTTSSNAEGSPTSFPLDDDSSVSDMSFISSATCVATNAFDKVIRMLLNHYPAAARIPHGRTGRLPLVMAIEGRRRSWEDGIKTLLDAFPPALESRRISMTIYPDILALVGNRDTTGLLIEGFPSNKKKSRAEPKSKGLSSLYELVRAKPNLIPQGQEV